MFNASATPDFKMTAEKRNKAVFRKVDDDTKNLDYYIAENSDGLLTTQQDNQSMITYNGVKLPAWTEKLSSLQKDKYIEEQLQAKSILQRRQWSQKFNITQDRLFELFSEFSSMILVNKFLTELNAKVEKTSKFKAKGTKPKDEEAVKDEMRVKKFFKFDYDTKMSVEYMARKRSSGTTYTQS